MFIKITGNRAVITCNLTASRIDKKNSISGQR